MRRNGTEIIIIWKYSYWTNSRPDQLVYLCVFEGGGRTLPGGHGPPIPIVPFVRLHEVLFMVARTSAIIPMHVTFCPRQ